MFFERRRLLSGLLLAAALAGCRENPVATDDDDVPPGNDNPDWTTASHGSAPPDYHVVFPQDSLNTLEIRMSAAQWAAVRSNMRALWGIEFGSRLGGGGGFPDVEPDYIAVDLRFGGRQWRSVGWRLKGNSSLNSAWRDGNYKLPFRLNFDEFEDSIPSIRNQKFYGFEEVSMSPGFADNSLIREKVTADIFRAAGIPAARTAFYRVLIDFGEGLKYCGVYTMVEVVDDTMIEDQFGSDAGNIYKPESRLQTFIQSEFELKNNSATADYADVRAFIAALNSPLRTSNPAQWRDGLEAVFDVDHFLRWLAVNNAIVNWDSYGSLAHNYYLYNHPDRGFVWIPWDHNQSFAGNPGITGTPGGGPGGPGGPRQGLSLTMNEVTPQWPLIRYLADDPVYMQRYRDHMRGFRDSVFTESSIIALFERYHTMITPHVIGPNGEQPGYSFITGSLGFSSSILQLRQHVANRRALLTQYLQ